VRPEEAPQLVRLGTLAAPLWKGNLRTLAAAQYRAGRFDESVRTFDEVVRLKFTLRAWDWLFLAMAHSRLGHTDEARRGLDEADRWIATADARDQAQTTGKESYVGWYEKVEVAALRREAATVVGGPSAAPNR
jgi:hypothetical protein